MKRRYKLIARLAVMVMVLSALAGCNVLGFRSWTWHQKLTISLMTPDGLKVASSVNRVSIGKYPEWWGVGDSRGSSDSSFSGEALALDLGGGRILFALLDNPTAERIFFPEPDEPRLWAQLEPLYDWMLTLRETREIPPKLYPRLITFDDLRVPSTLRLLTPGDLASVFGDGYYLNSVTLAITTDPVTKKSIEGILPWLEPWGRSHVNIKGTLPSDYWKNELDAKLYTITTAQFSSYLYK